MRALLPLRTAGVLAAVPVLVLLALALSGLLAWLPALVSIAIIGGGALLVANAWLGDIAHVARALHDASIAPATHSASLGLPRFPAIAQVAQQASRFARSLGTRNAELESVLRAEQNLLRHLPDPLIILAANRTVQRVNLAAEAAFGADIPAVLRHPGLRAAIDRAQAEHQTQSAEISLPVPSPRDVYATVIPLRIPLADSSRIVAVLSDRTRERAVEQMRADFVANASHELRTPLASLIGFIDTLRGPARDDPVAQSRFLGIMAEQAQRMNRLIDDLLSLSRVELTEHQAPADRVDIAHLVQRMADTFEPQVARRRMTLHIDRPDKLPPVSGDEDQLEQVLQNLLENAVKYGREAGTIRLAVQAAPPGKPWPARPGIAISVADDGQGIARAHIPRLTERFYRADKHRSRAVGGTGLGLAIVKHIMNRHRGQLAIDSAEGVGTTVTVWLPSLPPEPAAAAENAAAGKA